MDIDTNAPRKTVQIDEIARKNARAILRSARSVGQVHIAEYAGITESMASRWCSENVESLGKALAAMGMKLVPADACCVRDADTLDDLLKWAKIGMASMKTAEDLLWDESE